MDRDEYVSTLCRIGDHAGCAAHPVVDCACDCHAVAVLDPQPPAGSEPDGEDDPVVEVAN